MRAKSTEPPLPCLAADADKEGLPRQEWNPKIVEQTYFTLQFQPTFEDHKRALSLKRYFYAKSVIDFIVFTVVAYAITAYVSYLVDSWSKKQWLHPTFDTLFKSFGQVFTVYCVFGVLAHNLKSEKLKKIKKAHCPPCTLTVTSTHIECDSTAELITLPYKKITAITYNRGNLYVRGKAPNTEFHIPQSAFPDRTSMESLYEALYSLWCGNGSLDALSPEVRTRFMPEATPSAGSADH